MALSLSSSAFEDGGPIPDEYGYEERNVNPPLEIEGVPPTAESLALIVDDPDAVDPAGKVWDHWVVWNVDTDHQQIPEDWDADDAVEGRNDYGEQGYGGPNPPDGEHTYRFELYALDRTLDVDEETNAETLRDTMDDFVLAEATLEGTYAP
ncbi:YbhB/YbcL family Raf kinase inhibitor-like protein [Natronomonas salina]|uniref:YbhB/YbcL family Raf kinase inhibitor-like protein n=1 Tax=Natronomonas salina TaxID=1710540 RepID=UPI0015B4F075|nr:YbhB/YbcL family Raf kinase inhibitor-like protein [Natronomonas salina]QLD88083.1 YbhB/YbcL family Raf kinase inhibitor-like protein [Natronomonas salina]